jgi:uncharacterized membrane protein YdjX (TVP38/TMEM64 family)
MKQKLPIIIIIAISIAAFFYYDAGQYLSLEYIKNTQNQLLTYYNNSPFIVILVFFLFYVVVTALSLPGATIMTLSAGMLFGLTWGVVIVSFASTIGASLAFIISRFILYSSIQEKYADKLDKINKGIKKEGAFYLFALRLVPLFPFFLINIIMGVTQIRLWTFFWVSQVGMFLGTIVYVYAGTELAKVNTLGDIVSIRLLVAFSILGLFPIVTKRLLEYVRIRKNNG